MAQFGRALRSGRRGRKFKSCRLDLPLTGKDVLGIWPHGQAVKTTPSPGVIPGSIPGEVMDALDEDDHPKHFSRFRSAVGSATHS